jgi:hypothetical protein
MDYSKMSDFEINRLVAKQFPEACLFNEEGNPYQLIPDSMAAYSGSDFDEVEFQPCGNPADAWPIIIAELIALKPVALFVGGHRWFASKGEGDFGIKHADENPLRAAMIVFLMMQESANAPANSTGTDLR